jgi:hypothetical protein
LDVRSPCACGKEGTLALPEGFRITTAMLWQGALVLALADLALLLLITRPVVWYCLLGGFWGVVTHTLAVFSGIVSKPPPLQGASPAAAVGIALFEFTFYWCVLVLGSLTVVRAAAAPRRRRTS